MWNNLLKITLVSYLWKRYKRTIIALPLLLLYFWFVNLVHHDIIAYATLNNDTSWLGWTFLVKWLFILLGVAVFVFIHATAKTVGESRLADSLRGGVKGNLKDKPKESALEDPDPLSPETEDVFDRIRHKKSLRSKADVVLEKRQ
ncbi:MAG: hypothetical protein ACRBBR_07850 [Cellvibrionaceae bacterium]